MPATAAPGTPPPATQSPAPTGAAADGWRELGSGMWLQEDPFAVAAAVDQPQFDELWDRLAQRPPTPAVDFERELVLFLGMSGSSSCPERLVRLLVDEAAGRVHGDWAAQPPAQPCTDDLQAQGVLLAVDRSLLPEGPFLFSLRDEPICPECPDRPDQVVVEPAR